MFPHCDSPLVLTDDDSAIQQVAAFDEPFVQDEPAATSDIDVPSFPHFHFHFPFLVSYFLVPYFITNRFGPPSDRLWQPYLVIPTLQLSFTRITTQTVRV